MKRIFILCLLVVATAALNSVSAQSFAILPADSVYKAGTVTSDFDDIESVILFKNTDSVSHTITWHLFSDTIVPGWELKLCDNNNCYDLLLNNIPYTTSPVAPGDTLIMKSQFSPHCMSGKGLMYVTTRVGGSSAAAQTITYSVAATAACVAGISDVTGELKSVTLYPNPAYNEINIGGLEAGHAYQIQITDLQGRVISEYNNSSNGAVVYNVSAIPAGMYFVKVLDNERKLSATKKFSKQ